MNYKFYFIFFVLLFSPTISFSQKEIKYAYPEKRNFISISEGVSFGNFNYTYRSDFSQFSKNSGTITVVDYSSEKNLVFIPYPGVEFDHVGRKGLRTNIDFNYFGINFTEQKIDGITTSYYFNYGPSNTVTSTTTFQSTFNQAQKIRIRYLSYSIGLGYSLALKNGDLMFSIGIGDLKPTSLQIETQYSTGSSSAFKLKNRFLDWKGVFNDNFIKGKINYVKRVGDYSSFNFGLSYLRKITPSYQIPPDKSYYSPVFRHVEFEKFNIISLYAAFTIDF